MAERGLGQGIADQTQGCIKLRDFSLSSIGWRRGLGRGWGEEARSYWFPLSSVLSPLVPRRERMVRLLQRWIKPVQPASSLRRTLVQVYLYAHREKQFY
jgi:hypothetical protein